MVVNKPGLRDYKVVLLGATGDAGKAIAATLARRAPASVGWAIAGRSESKLKKMQAQLTDRYGSTPDVLLADASSEDQLLQLTARTSVLISAAGPYVKFGDGVISSCIQTGTNYMDITGEVQWVADVKAKYADKAAQAGVCICNFCGYDVIVNELSLTACMRAAGNDPLTRVESVSHWAGGGMPHGTLLFLTELLDIAHARSLKRGMFKFVSEAERGPLAKSLMRWAMPLRWSMTSRCFTIPHAMGMLTTPVIHSTAASLGSSAIAFSDRQVIPEIGLRSSPFTLWGLLPGIVVLAGLAVSTVPMAGLALLLSTRKSAFKWIERLLSGYSYHGDEKASIRVRTKASTKSGKVVRAEFGCAGDAGIWCTGKLAGVTALMMAEQNELPAGFCTPASLGDGLVKSLLEAGVEISATVVSEP